MRNKIIQYKHFKNSWVYILKQLSFPKVSVSCMLKWGVAKTKTRLYLICLVVKE